MKTFSYRGKPISYGAVITTQVKIGGETVEAQVTLTPESEDLLVKAGIVRVKSSLDITYNLIVTRVKIALDISEEEAEKFLNNLKKVSPSLYWKYLLRECSQIMDNSYKTPLHKEPFIHYVDSNRGDIVAMPSRNLTKSAFRLQTFFHTFEDASKAKQLVNRMFKDIFEDNE